MLPCLNLKGHSKLQLVDKLLPSVEDAPVLGGHNRQSHAPLPSRPLTTLYHSSPTAHPLQERASPEPAARVDKLVGRAWEPNMLSRTRLHHAQHKLHILGGHDQRRMCIIGFADISMFIQGRNPALLFQSVQLIYLLGCKDHESLYCALSPSTQCHSWVQIEFDEVMCLMAGLCSCRMVQMAGPALPDSLSIPP